MKRTLAWIAAALVSGSALGQGAEHPQLRAVTALARMAFGFPATCKEASVVITPNWQFDPVADYASLSSGSPNHRLLARTWYYGWALRSGTAAQKADARTLLEEFIRRQSQTWGHYSSQANADEILTSSHFQLWAAGITAAYVLALANGGVIQNGQDPYTSGDTAVPSVRNAARRWWLEEKKLWDFLVSFEGGEAVIDAPGARINFTGPIELRDLIYKLLKGQIPSKSAQWWDQCYNSGARMMRDLNNGAISPSVLGTPLAGEVIDPKVHDTLCIYRRGADYLFSFPQLRAAGDPLFWTARVGPNHAYGALQSGKPVLPNPPPTPEVTAAFQGVVPRTVPALVASGAATCPQY